MADMTVLYCNSYLTFIGSVAASRFYLRYNTSSSTAEVYDTDDYTGKWTTDKKWHTNAYSIPKNTKLAANFWSTNGTSQLSPPLTFTSASSSSLISSLNDTIVVSSKTTSSITIKLQGWAIATTLTSNKYPNMTVTCNDVPKTFSYDYWRDTGYTFTGLSSNTSYTIAAKLTTPNWDVASKTVTTNKNLPSVSFTSATQTEEGVGSIQCSFSVSNATSLSLKYKLSTATSYSTVTLSTSATSYTLTGLTVGKTYYLYLSATNKDGTTDSASKSVVLKEKSVSTIGWYVYNGSKWVKVTPYIYNGSKWVQCTPYLYSNGWIAGS